MIREHRNREKLIAYYDKFVNTGEMDPNVHPWVADSWRKSQALHVPKDRIRVDHRLTPEAFLQRKNNHQAALEYLESMADGIREFLQKYDLCLLLLDTDCVVLKSYALPYFQMTAGEIEGVRVGLEDVGTSSISIALEHEAPFLLFGPEMWVADCHGGDACSTPIYTGGELAYIMTLVSVAQTEIPQDAVISLLLILRQSLESYLCQTRRLKAQEAILDATPFAVYHVTAGGEVAYANRLGLTRLAGIGVPENHARTINLNDVVLNYRHTPIYEGFRGVPCHNKEVTWITRAKTYEDITTVVPLAREAEKTVPGVVVVSMPIEDLRTLVAHASGYTSKYSLNSMVGESAVFTAMQERAARMAKNTRHLLLQGEAGAGKQRLAHGIHQASPRAAGPLITLHCGDATPDFMEQEIFGVALNGEDSHPGRLELASGGTLFLDEVEKMPKLIAAKLAAALKHGYSCRLGETVERPVNVRIIAACDSDLRRLAERSLVDRSLYEIVSKSIIRVPPLRSRRDDIPQLTAHMLTEMAAQHRMLPKTAAPQTIEMLCAYDWPGNVKQLQSVLEYAFFNTKGSVIYPENINLMGDIKPDGTWKEDRDVFVKAWKAAGGNISRLANLLDVSRVTLYRYLKKFGLEKA
ncbi:MAG: sigma 54-interacting transcriptional regulator [Schwartzia sp. (in: firmicutes)]